MTYKDRINAEIDGRKIADVIDKGIMTPEEIINAPTIVVKICEYCDEDNTEHAGFCIHCKEMFL